MQQISHKAKAVFEVGTIKTKQGNAVPARLVVQVVKVVADLMRHNDYVALQELKVKMIGPNVSIVSESAIEAIGADTAHDILEDGHIMTVATSEIIRDIVREPLLGQGTRPILDASHYAAQFKAKANKAGGTVRLNSKTGKFQFFGLGS